MSTRMQVAFQNVSASPVEWDFLVKYLSEVGRFVELLDDYVAVELRNAPGFPTVHGFPDVTGVSWEKWYLEESPDEQGFLGVSPEPADDALHLDGKPSFGWVLKETPSLRCVRPVHGRSILNLADTPEWLVHQVDFSARLVNYCRRTV